MEQQSAPWPKYTSVRDINNLETVTSPAPLFACISRIRHMNNSGDDPMEHPSWHKKCVCGGGGGGWGGIYAWDLHGAGQLPVLIFNYKQHTDGPVYGLPSNPLKDAALPKAKASLFHRNWKSGQDDTAYFRTIKHLCITCSC